MFENNKIHLVGVGGVSMSALCDVLFQRGFSVSGSDRNENAETIKLRELGIPIYLGEPAITERELHGCNAVIRTAAAKDDNPEIVLARRLNIPVFERAEAWGEIMREYSKSVCIAGTHGKTTTSGMFSYIALPNDPTIMLGGSLPVLGSGHRVGKGDMIILESCEYCNSYFYFKPTTAVILNIEADHLDFFKDLNDIISSFRQFAEGHFTVANRDDANVREALCAHNDVLWFGRGENCDVFPKNIAINKGCYSFDAHIKGEFFVHITLNVPGEHNLYNALAAVGAAWANGINPKQISEGLALFTGAGRRMEPCGTINGADVFDDYAHHPTEITATLKSVRAMGYKRIICAFQPHTYTRTKALFDDFVTALKLCDKVYIAPIYAARERNHGDINSSMLSAEIPNAESCESFCEIAEKIKKEAKDGDVILTMGAGNINTLFD